MRSSSMALMLTLVVALSAAPACGQFMTLCTTFAGGNGQSGNMFDVTANNPVIITGFDQVFGGAGSSIFEIYMVTGGGSYIGNETNAAAWTLLGSATVTTTGVGTPDPIPVPISVNLNPGQTQGFYLVNTAGTNVTYTNGSTLGALFASDANLDFFEGIGSAYPFGGTFSPRVWNGCIKYQLAQQFADDLLLQSIDAPTSSDPNSCMPTLSNAEQVTVRIFNIGMNPVPMGTQIPVSFQLNGGVQVANEMTAPLAAPLAPLTSLTYTFAATVDLSVPATYTLDAAVALPGDLDGSNDLKTEMITSLAGPSPGNLPFFENFDTFGATVNGNAVPTGWINDPTDGTADWLFETDFPGSNNGPDFDHTTMVPGAGWYAFIEDSVSTNSAINLLTPCIDLSGTTAPMATFWVNNNQTANPLQQNFLAIDVEAVGSGLVTDIVPAIGHTQGQWTQFQVELNSFIGGIIRLQFRGQDDNNGSPTSINDYGLDDVTVFDFAEGLGQRPQFGLATLDVGNATEANGFPVDLGVNGPYFSTVPVGTNAMIDMGGAPNQPIVLLAGTLSVNTAAFGLVGQLDVNNPGLEIVGDGTSSGFFNSFFILDGVGSRQFLFNVSPAFAGMQSALQAIMLTGTPLVIAFSNAVDVMFL